MKITTENVKEWLGERTTVTDCAEILAEIANGEYPVNMLKDDIEQTIEQ